MSSIGRSRDLARAPRDTAGGPHDPAGTHHSRGQEPHDVARGGRDRSAGARDLVAGVMIVVLLSTLVDGPAVWLIGVLLLAAVGFGVLQVLADDVPSVAGLGVPVEALVAPGIAVIAIYGSIRLVPMGLLLVPALLFSAWALHRVMRIEARLLGSEHGASSADRTTVTAWALVAGFLAFVGIAALVPGGLPEPGPIAAGPTGIQLAALAVGDALVAFLLGYRTGALRSSNVRDVAWFALTSALLIAIAAAALRTLEIPRLAGPALLVLVFFLWDAMHGSGSARRREARRLWETALLVILGGIVIVWSIRLHG